MKEPLITVGILSGKEIEFSFPETFVSSDKIESAGDQKAVYKEGKIYVSINRKRALPMGLRR